MYSLYIYIIVIMNINNIINDLHVSHFIPPYSETQKSLKSIRPHGQAQTWPVLSR